MEVVLSNVAILASFSLIGWILNKMQILNRQHVKLLSALEVWLFLPCKTFQGFAANFTVEYLSERYLILIVSVIVLAALVRGGLPSERFFGNDLTVCSLASIPVCVQMTEWLCR